MLTNFSNVIMRIFHYNRVSHLTTGGYQGQVQVIKKGKYECYECNQKKSDVKTYPGCTIRNTPSEPIHCIVWGKHLFNQLFGEPDPDQDVSPDTADPEAVADAGSSSL